MTFKNKIALIGLGSIAQKAYLPILSQHEQVDPVLCTRSEDVLNTLGDKYRINARFTKLEDAIQSGIDAAMVHSATESHYPLVKQLLKAKIPTFVDKPLAYSIGEVEELLNLAAQHNVLLYMGFNRRFVPMIQNIKKERKLLHLVWEKNRVNLPADPRSFIYDDFIHVLDSLRFLSGGEVKNLQVHCSKKKNFLERIYVQWQHNTMFIEGKMNRVSGITEERVTGYMKDAKYELETLESGMLYRNEKQTPLSYDPWAPTLYKRGFEGMIDDWLNVLQTEEQHTSRYEDIRQTHQLCDEVLNQVL